MDANDLTTQIKNANGSRRQRLVDLSDAQTLIDTMSTNPDAHVIRVYSRQGFVANAYKYRADISALQATKMDGVWVVTGISVDGKRSYGQGALVTVDGRAAR